MENRQGEGKNSVGNVEAKELVSMTHRHSSGFKKNCLSGLPEIPVTLTVCHKYSVEVLLTMEYVSLVSIKNSTICTPSVSFTQASRGMTLIDHCND